jgi:hypothetical protein
MTRLLLIFLLAIVTTAFGDVQFDRDIRPILSDRCFQCHGPDEHDRRGKLRLDQTGGADGAYTKGALSPGSLADSELWQRIHHQDPDEVMPPPEAEKKPLTKTERALIRQWIEEGAAYQDFWAFVPPKIPVVEVGEGQPIDQLVQRQLKSEGRQLSPEADRRRLIRRATLDITGLPPTRKEIREFLADTSEGAYEALVDRLLAKHAYGEHMTKYWLDLVRFADTNGIHHDHFRDMTPYRDWVIRSFNENLPYDRFVVAQLAGDLYEAPSRDQLIASGFNRLHLIIDVGTALPEESFTKNVIDRVTAVGMAFMGLTVQCAVCHDHKYDPITAKDFYQLYAFFNNLDAKPETGGRSGTDFKRGLQIPYIDLTSTAQEAELSELARKIKSAETGAQRKALEEKRDALLMTIPAAMVMKEKSEVRPAHILVRGAYDNPGEQVQRGTPAFLPPMRAKEGKKTRMDLAEWFVSKENPLTARVAVNRVWQQFFGVGLVKTSEDFGNQGEWPSYPELIDYLAVTFMESGWDTKSLVKEIVLSKTYKQVSEANPEVFRADPENRALARGSRFRMDSEMIRDQLLVTSGMLNEDMFGKSVKPPQPKGLWKSVGMPSSYPREYVPDEGDEVYRRSVYTFWKRGMPPPQMTILNAPSREACIARRERTNTPLQALLLLNEQEYLKAARHLGLQVLGNSTAKRDDRLTMVYETITSALPDAQEKATLQKALADLIALYQGQPELAEQLCDGVESPPSVEAPELAAWTMLISSLYNLDITKTRQ